MIGQRFRAVGWVAGIASAATCLYLTSLQVAAERATLEGVEAKIVAARRDMRQLQTELGTRASLRQLERWNGEVLALSAPRAEQYLHAESELASVGVRELRAPTPGRAGAPSAPVMLAAAQATPMPTPVPAPAPVAAPVVLASISAARPPAAATPARPTLQHVAFVPAARAKPTATVTPARPKADAPASDRSARTGTKVREAVVKPKPKPAPEATAAHRARPVLTRVALSDITRAAAVEGRRR